mmetsp:Transcript_141774/g.395286  ORF Transcript_141774/g.395286 Transcript_141774/m.395286 type:complete len:215 (+) Transcript_141774:72-716(+)
MGKLGPDTVELLRRHRAVKVSDVVAIINEGLGEQMFLDVTGNPDIQCRVSVSKGIRTQDSSCKWGFGTKPAGSPSAEVNYGTPVYLSTWVGVRELFLNVDGDSGFGKFALTITEEDRIPSSAFVLEPLPDSIKENDPKCCYTERCWITSTHGGVTTYLSVRGPGVDGNAHGLCMSGERDPEGKLDVWTVRYGGDLIASGMREVGFDPNQFPPQK